MGSPSFLDSNTYFDRDSKPRKQFVSFLDPEAQTTKDGHAYHEVQKAWDLIADAMMANSMKSSGKGDPSKIKLAGDNALARIVVDGLAYERNTDITRRFFEILHGTQPESETL